MTGTNTAPTQTSSDNSTKLATTAFVQTALAGVGGAPCYDWNPQEGGTMTSSLASPNGSTAVGSFTFNCPSQTYTKIAISVNTADNTGDLYDIGFYTSAGSLLCHIGGTAGSAINGGATGFTNLTMLSTGCAFTQGSRYYLAVTGNAATFKYGAVGSATYAYRVGSVPGGTPSVAGTLNSSVTPGADSYQNANPMPWFSMHN